MEETKRPESEVFLNEEHREAYQEQVTKYKKEFVAKLSPEDKEKHRVIEKAMSDLGAAGINCYLFAEVATNEEEPQIMQYNTGGLFLEYKNGKVTKQCMIDTAGFHSKVMLSISASIFDKTNNWLNNLIETNKFQCLLYSAAQWIYGGIEPENVKQLKKEIEEEK